MANVENIEEMELEKNRIEFNENDNETERGAK